MESKFQQYRYFCFFVLSICADQLGCCSRRPQGRTRLKLATFRELSISTSLSHHNQRSISMAALSGRSTMGSLSAVIKAYLLELRSLLLLVGHVAARRDRAVHAKSFPNHTNGATIPIACFKINKLIDSVAL